MREQSSNRILLWLAGVLESLSGQIYVASRLIPLSRSSFTFDTFLEELEVLGLKGKGFGPEEYARSLASYLGIEVRIELVQDAENPEALRSFVESGHTACLWYDEQASIARIFVLSSLPPLEMTAAIYHELGHLAAGHRLDLHDPSGLVGTRTIPARTLARRRPDSDRREMEKEATLREEFAITAGALGNLCLSSESRGQIA